MPIVSAYPFLWLGLLLGMIGLMLICIRPDLSRMLGVSVAFALPFAFTEPLFYPAYWSPPFLFDLAARLGFGIEDFVFLAALAVIASGLFPVVSGARLVCLDPRTGPLRTAMRGAGLLAVAGAVTLTATVLGLHAIYAAPLVMTVMLVWMLRGRPDLIGVALGGAVLTGMLYGIVLGVVDLAGGGVIARDWHTERFLNLTWSGIPAEEWIYGFAAGGVGAVFYPYCAACAMSVAGARRPLCLTAWLQSLRLPAQVYIVFPLLLGQAIAARQQGAWQIHAAVWLHAFGLLIHVFIVWANDFADEAVDRINTMPTMFSGGSRVLPRGLLTSRHLHAAIRWSLAAGTLCATGLWILHRRPLAPPFLVVSWFLLWAYSFPPLRASYRGYGETLQMAGIGIVLPLFGYYGQTGTLANFPWPLLLAVLPTQLACALTTAMPDAPADQAGGKHTLWLRLGTVRGYRSILCLQAFSIIVTARVVAGLRAGWCAWLPPALLFTLLLAEVWRMRERAFTERRAMKRVVGLSVAITVGLTAWLALRFIL